MLHQCPCLEPDLRLRWEHIEPQGLLYTLERPHQPRTMRLAPVGVLMVMLMDGRASVQNVDLRAQRLGIEAPAGFLDHLVTQLFQLGFARLRPAHALEHQILPGTQHDCEACGRSCQGQLIGPLATGEAQRIFDLYDTLAQTRPRLQDQQPIVTVPDQPGLHLNLCEGRCIFLDHDGLCAIHRTAGMEAKPSICQTFPYVRVYTEEGLRLGLANHCFRHHRQWQPTYGPPLRATLPESLRSLPTFTVYHAPFDTLPFQRPDAPTRQRRARFLSTEARVLDYLATREASLSGLAALMLGDEPNATAQPSRFTPQALAHFHTALQRLAAQDLSPSFLSFILESHGALADTFRKWHAHFSAYVAKPPTGLIAFDPRSERYVLELIRRHLWLREALRFPSPFAAVAWMIAGALVAQVASNGAADPFDTFGEMLATWQRFTNEDERFALLFPQPQDAQRALAAVARLDPHDTRQRKSP